jgi:AraC family transcriptional regulator, regulatory protein of adaptative response / DNA-3-methyladenine glycosylase II
MDLDQQICSQARLTRDPRFDGRFFIGVRTSRVYCRSICPARTAREENVRYYPTAAAAAEAGFRPCLRCRPESSPGTPAWLGTSSTVSRGLRLISESAMEDGGVDALAERLGIGARHLRRLFIKHLGASPSAVANTRRLHFAKKLIDETNLPMGQIAIAAGFGSVRRFNAAIQSVYKRTPTQIRRLANPLVAQPYNEYLFRLRYRPPFQWERLLSFLSARAIPGVEAVDPGRYSRTISLNGQIGTLAVSHDEIHLALEVHISFPEPRALFLIIERVRRMFDLLADPSEITACFRADPLLGRRVTALPGLRVPGCWDGFELSVRAILGQQVSVKGASTLAGRLVQKFGKAVVAGPRLTHLFPTPNALAEGDVASIGLPKNRAETIRTFARAVSKGEITFGPIASTDDFLMRLCELPGIGDWTAQYIAMRALGVPDAFPASDLGLLRGASIKDPRELSARSETWRPWRAYAAMYLWQCGPEECRERKEAESSKTRVLARDAYAAVSG